MALKTGPKLRERDYIKERTKISTKFALLILAAILIMCPLSVSAHALGAYNVVITKDYVKATGRCTCSLQSDYTYHTVTFKNYCPNCHHKGTLRYEEGPASWTCPEGMWYCTRCDMDFCLIHGKSHDNRGHYLVRINNPSVKKITNNSNNAPKVNAQNKVDENVQIVVNGKKYSIKKSVIHEINRINLLWLEKINISI